MRPSTGNDRNRKARAGCLAALAVVFGCSGPGEEPPERGAIHLAELLAPPGADPGDPPLPAPRPGWRFPEHAVGWTAPGSTLASTDEGLVASAANGRALLASPELSVPLASIHSIELRVRATEGARLHVSCDEPAGDYERRFAQPDWDPSEDPVHRIRGVRFKGTAKTRDYRILARDLWRDDPEAAGTTVSRLYVAALSEGPAEVTVESVGIVRREDLRPGAPRALVRETRSGIGMHAARLVGGVESRAAVDLPERARLRFSVASAGEAAAGALVVAAGRDGSEEILFRRDADRPFRDWEPVDIDLSAYGAGEVELVFRTEGDAGVRWLVGAPVVVGPWSGRNLLVYMIDTMRADVLEPYGYPHRTSPVLSRLAREGVLFEDCISTSSWTRPAAASLLTSRSAPAHGVVHERSSLPDDVVTWAETLRERGYYTVAFFTNPNAGRPSRLDRGFDTTMEISHLLDFAGRSRSPGAWQGGPSGTSEGISRRFADWIDGAAGLPLFLYLHTNDPHTPWQPRPPFDALPRFPSPSGERPKAFGRYGGDVRVADHFLGEVLRSLERHGLLDRTVVAVVSDHGEEFKDHGGLGHGTNLWKEQLRVPLLIRAPWALPPGGIHRGRVSLLDILPTIVDLAGLDATLGLEGRSLGPELGNGGARFSEQPVFAHVIRMNVRLDDDAMEGADFPGDLTVLQGRWKLIVQDYGDVAESRTRLYDLAVDPGERENLAGQHPERARSMAELARAWYDAARAEGRELPDEVELDPETVEQLRALGYLD